MYQFPRHTVSVMEDYSLVQAVLDSVAQIVQGRTFEEATGIAVVDVFFHDKSTHLLSLFPASLYLCTDGIAVLGLPFRRYAGIYSNVHVVKISPFIYAKKYSIVWIEIIPLRTM
jgi:hypothetical protein